MGGPEMRVSALVREQVAVTPSDTVAFDPPLDGLAFNADGVIYIVLENDANQAVATKRTVTAGMELPCRVTYVFETDNELTTAGDIVGLRL